MATVLDCITLSSDDEEPTPSSPSRPGANGSGLRIPTDVSGDGVDVKNFILPASSASPGSSHGLTHKNLSKEAERNLNFDTFASFNPVTDKTPGSNRLLGFIDNVKQLTEEKKKLEVSERKLREQCEQADSQLNSATQEISKLKENLTQSESKLNQQKGTIDELKNLVDKLKKQETGDRSKLRSVTTNLVSLQKKMVQILEDTEINVGDEVGEEAEEEPSSSTNMVHADMHGSLAERMLRENIENFERDFEEKFNQIEEQDKEIQDEISKTNQMLERIQASILEKFPGGGRAAGADGGERSPQLTYESMEDQDGGNNGKQQTGTRSSPRSPKKIHR